MTDRPKLSNKQIAEHFGFTTARAAALIRQGMPVDSLEAAESWRHARLLRGQRGGVEQRAAIVVNPDDVSPDLDFEDTVVRHRELKEAARQAYIAARNAGDTQAPKLYTTYQSIVQSLVKLERESLARKIESKELIKTAAAIERFGRVIAEIKADMLAFANAVANQVNPDNQGKAYKVIDEKVNSLLAKWANSAETVIEETLEAQVSGERPDFDNMPIEEEMPPNEG
jgi:hypothetical protein